MKMQDEEDDDDADEGGEEDEDEGVRTRTRTQWHHGVPTRRRVHGTDCQGGGYASRISEEEGTRHGFPKRRVHGTDGNEHTTIKWTSAAIRE